MTEAAFAPCSVCSARTLESLLDWRGRCPPCVRKGVLPPTEDELIQQKFEEAVAAAERTRQERVLLKEGLVGPEKPQPPQPAELAEQELARRELARRRLLPFVTRFNPTYTAGWVHKVICEELEWFVAEVEAKRSPRLILEMPPRHGKSELVSRNLPPWALGKHPEWEIIGASHTTSLSLDFSRKARSIVRQPEYTALFRDAQLDPDIQSAEQWRMSKGGGYTAVGVGSAVVGKGAHILLIDDPIPGAVEAESFKSREEIKQWYQTEAYTRLAPGGGVLIIMQRWHDEDLAGWLIERARRGEGEPFRVVRFPAIATEDEKYRRAGEPLHPERYPLDLLENIRRNMAPRQWEALYQQNPVPDTGAFFLKEFFRFYEPDELPPLEEMNVYATWDLAIGQNEQNDFTAGFIAGLSRNDDLWILDHHHGRWNAMDIVERILDSQKARGARVVGLEKGHIQMTLGPFLTKRMVERRQMGFLLHPLVVGRRDKQSRARSIQGRMQQGKVYWPAKAPWIADVMRELMRFPNGQHDDRVDAIAHMGLLLDEMVVTRAPVPKQPKSWVDRLVSRRPSLGTSAMSA